MKTTPFCTFECLQMKRKYMNVYVSSNSQHVIFVDKPLKLMLKCVLDKMKLMIWIVVSKKERKTKTGVLASLNYKTFCWCGRVRFHLK